MIQIPAILREIASFGGSLYEKGPPPIAVLHVVAGGVWLQGACMVVGGGMHGCPGEGACVVAGGDVRRIRRDTVNERAVRIILECILV